MKVVMVGAGIGGLCTAILLATEGFDVDVFEQNDAVGGKLWRVNHDDYHFSYGPSTLTMPDIFRGIVARAGENPEDWLPYVKLPVNHRNFFADGEQFDATTDVDRMLAQLSRFNSEDARQWPHYLAAAKRMYDHSVGTFFRRTFTEIGDFVSPSVLSSMIGIRPWQSLTGFHQRFFQDPRVLMSVNRYATYVGSRPDKAPAVLGMIGHLEFGDGVYYLPGGTAVLTEALSAIAKQCGVQIHLKQAVERVCVEGREATGVVVNQSRIPADAVVVNADVLTAYHRLIDATPPVKRVRDKLAHMELAHSALVVLLGVRGQDRRLTHHNVFFPDVYEQEFDDLFTKHQLPTNGTVYLCNTSATDATQAPAGCSNLFMLLNAPARLTWDTDAVDAYIDRVLARLADQYDLPLTPNLIAYREIITPGDLAERTGAYCGSIYGPSSNDWHQAFFRPRLAAPGVGRLYFVGGSTHPGGGTPMVAMSAMLVSDLVTKRFGAGSRSL